MAYALLCHSLEVTCGNMRYYATFMMLLVAISVIMPRGPFGPPVLGQRQALGKVYKMENTTL